MLDLAAFAGASGIDDDVPRRCRIVLELDPEVIETCLLVVARYIRKLVKPTAEQFWQRNRNATVSRTFEVIATHRKRCSYGLTRQPRRINLDRVGSLSGDNRSCRYCPVIGRRDVCRNS